MNIFEKVFRFKKRSESAGINREAERASVAGAWNEEFVEPTETLTVRDIEQLYDSSVLLKKYVRGIINEILRFDIVAVPIKGYEGDRSTARKVEYLNSLLSSPNDKETFREIREMYLKDLLLFGRGGIELQPAAQDTNLVTAMYAIPGYCIRLNVDQAGNFKDKEKAYKIVSTLDPSKVISTFPFNSLVYFTFDKLSDQVYPSSPIFAIQNELNADIAASQSLRNGMNDLKSGIICIDRFPNNSLAKLINELKWSTTKRKNFKITAVNRDGKFIDLTNMSVSENLDAQKWLTVKANIFNIPLFRLGLGEKVGSLSAREQKDDLKVLAGMFVQLELDKLNSILVKAKLGYSDVKLTSPSLASKLDYERARIAVRLVNAGIITPNEARTLYLNLPPLASEEANRLQTP